MRGRNHHVEDMIFIVPTDMPPNEVRGRYPGMKIDRLIGILSVLLQEEKTTAPELAERFEVSRRTALFDPSMKWQLVEEYGVDSFMEQGDGSLLFEHEYADDEGLLSWMLSCRDKVTVLEPERIREKLYQITSEIAKRYEGERE